MEQEQIKETVNYDKLFEQFDQNPLFRKNRAYSMVEISSSNQLDQVQNAKKQIIKNLEVEEASTKS
tara:strand:+ start:163 stop:360 length:198 start_codon:yes stop_codon:yes gene_type:complete